MPITMDETKKFVGNGAEKLIERAFKATGRPAKAEETISLTDEFLAFYDGHEADETIPYETVLETLATLKDKGFRLALCTNKPQVPTQNLLRELGMLGFFEVILGGDQLDRKKPDPQMIQWVLDKMETVKENAIMIGDSPNDIDAAKNAQMRSIAVSYGYRKVPVEELGADHIVDCFDQILDIITP